jgi:hexosaminidase
LKQGRRLTVNRDITKSNMKRISRIVGTILCLLAATTSAIAANADSPAVIPLPQKMQLQPGTFKLTADTHICAESISGETAQFLAARLREATGYPVTILSSESNVIYGNILLTTKDAKSRLGPEGYELMATPESVVIRAPTQAGLFYGVQTLLQLLPSNIFSTNVVTNVDWQMPCVQIEDWPRFKWRGLMLDVSRHFFTTDEVEQLLNAMATLKMNVFHWHLTDDQGWRIEIKKYPKLTQIGAWRPGVGFGLDPKSTTAYGPDGRYGGFYTPEDIREVVKYAAARHITIVPEIEMPGHSMAALAAYPRFSCTGGPFTIPLTLGVFNGIYDPANEATFTFLDEVLTEVFQLFPGKYVHLGGDEVPKDTWKNSEACQALMKREDLTNENELQGWFMQRMERFAEAHGRIPIGWSEILEGGLASNTVVMDWIGGATEAATSGHDVVMTPHESCYLCYYPSLDRPPNLRAYRPYLPLSRVYAFEPIPATLQTQYDSHILGVEASVWTPDIPSMSDVEELTFPRADALAEAGWSAESARNFDDFSRRMNVGCERLALSGIKYWRDNATQIGEWKPAQITRQNNLLEWDATQEITAPGKYRLSLDYTGGKNGLTIQWAALLEDGREISRDAHAGFTGTSSRAMKARDWNYFFNLPAFKQDAQYMVRAVVVGDSGNDSKGVVFLGEETAK